MGILANGFFNFGSFLFPGRFNQALSLVQRPFDNQILMNSKTAQFINIDRDNLLEVYRNCPHLSIVLNKQAEMLSNGCLKIRKKSNKEDVEKHWALELMKNPNPLQSQREYIYEYSLYRGIFSNNFVYILKPFTSSPPKTITNLPSGMMRITTTGKWLDQTELSGIIQSYDWLVNASYGSTYQTIRSFDTTEVLHTNTGLSRTPYMADSKLIALQMPISNIISAYKTRNILINENAGITILSSESRDQVGSIPLNDIERARIENDFRNTKGLRDDQQHKIITNSPVTVTPLVFPVDQMKLFEEVEDDFSAICGAFGMDRDLFPSVKGATFENKKQGEIATYNGIIQTEATALCNFLDILLLAKEDAEFWMDYSHVASMKEKVSDKAAADKIFIESVGIMVDKNMINPNQGQALVASLTGYAADKSLESNNALANSLREFSPLVANNILSNLTINQILGMLNLPPVEGGDVPSKLFGTQNTNTP